MLLVPPWDFRTFLRLLAPSWDLHVVSQLRSLRKGRGLDKQIEYTLGALESAAKVWTWRVWCLHSSSHEMQLEGQPRDTLLTS